MNDSYSEVSQNSCDDPSNRPNDMIRPVLSVDAVYNDYKVVDRLGQGGSGTVYLVVPMKEFPLLQAYHNDMQSMAQNSDNKTSRCKPVSRQVNEDLAETVASPAAIPKPLELPESNEPGGGRFADDLEFELSKDESEEEAFEQKRENEKRTLEDNGRIAGKRDDYIPRSAIRRAVTSGVIRAYVLKHIVFASEFDPKRSSNNPESDTDQLSPGEDSIASFEKDLLDLIKSSSEGYIPLDLAARVPTSFTSSRDLAISPASLFRSFVNCALPRRRALCEALCLASLQHPHIISLAAAFIAPSGAALLIEWGAFGDLDRYIRAARTLSAPPISEFLVTKCIAQLALALSNLHSNRILHRDLKSPNVFLALDDSMFTGPNCKLESLRSSQTEILRQSLPKIDLLRISASSEPDEGELTYSDSERDDAHAILASSVVKIGDFGTAHTLMGTEDQAKTQIGTPFYLSPEICEGKAYGTGSDIWALGIISYELMTFNRPFVGSNIAAVVYQIISKSPPALSKDLYSKPLRKLVRQMLAKDPAKRPSADKILRHVSLARALEAIQAGKEAKGTAVPELSKSIRKSKVKARDSLAGLSKQRNSSNSRQPTAIGSSKAVNSTEKDPPLVRLNVSGRSSLMRASQSVVTPSNSKSGTLRKGRPVSRLSTNQESKADSDNSQARLHDKNLVVRPSLSSTKQSKSHTERLEMRERRAAPVSRVKSTSLSLKRGLPGAQTPDNSKGLTIRGNSRIDEESNSSLSSSKARSVSSGRILSGSVARSLRSNKSHTANEQTASHTDIFVESKSGDVASKVSENNKRSLQAPPHRMRTLTKSPDSHPKNARLRKPEPPWQCSDCYFLNQPVRTTCMCCSSGRNVSQTNRQSVLEVERVKPHNDSTTHPQNSSEELGNVPLSDRTRRTSVSWRDLHTIASQVRQSIRSLPVGEVDEDSAEEDAVDEDEDTRDDVNGELREDSLGASKHKEEDEDSLYENETFEESSEVNESLEGAVDLIWECPNCRIAYELPENQQEARCSMCDAHDEWDDEDAFSNV